MTTGFVTISAMKDMTELKALFRLLGVRPRLAIVDAIARNPGSDAPGIASAVSMAEYEVDPHLIALHEGGVIALEDDGWHVSPKVKAKSDGEFLHLAGRTGDGNAVRLRFRSDDT